MEPVMLIRQLRWVRRLQGKPGTDDQNPERQRRGTIRARSGSDGSLHERGKTMRRGSANTKTGWVLGSFLLAAAGFALCAPPAAWGNSAPVVSNVTASQRTDASKLVDIYYSLADADGDTCTVTAQASNDGGATWAVPPDGAARYDMGRVAGT
jgi:hypothetical protein